MAPEQLVLPGVEAELEVGGRRHPGAGLEADAPVVALPGDLGGPVRVLDAQAVLVPATGPTATGSVSSKQRKANMFTISGGMVASIVIDPLRYLSTGSKCSTVKSLTCEVFR